MIDLIKINAATKLTRISMHDADDIFRLIDQNRNKLRQWLPFVDATHTAENTRAFINSLQSPHSREMVFTITCHNQIAGLIGFKDIDRANKKLEIGYWLAPQFEGRGLVTESCRVLINKAFDNMKMNRIQIKCGVGNDRSSNIPKKLGFRFEGIEYQGERHQDRYLDLEVYSMLRDDWGKSDNKRNGNSNTTCL